MIRRFSVALVLIVLIACSLYARIPRPVALELEPPEPAGTPLKLSLSALELREPITCQPTKQELAEFEQILSSKEDVALIDAGKRALEKKYDSLAMRFFNKVCTLHPNSVGSGIANLYIGVVHEKHNRWNEAITSINNYLKSLNVDLEQIRDETYEKNLAIKSLSIAYEGIGDFDRALKLHKFAFDRGPPDWGCGTCSSAAYEPVVIRQAELLQKAGRDDDALKLIEPRVFRGSASEYIPIAVTIYNKRKQIDKLNNAIDWALQERLEQLNSNSSDQIDFWERYISNRTKQYIELTKHAEAGDLESIWTMVCTGEYRHVNNYLVTGKREKTTELTSFYAIDIMLANPKRSVPFLNSKLPGDIKEHGLAYLLLAKMKTPNLLPKIIEGFELVKKEYETLPIKEEERRAKSDRLLDVNLNLVYALALLRTPSANAEYIRLWKNSKENDYCFRQASNMPDKYRTHWYICTPGPPLLQDKQ